MPNTTRNENDPDRDIVMAWSLECRRGGEVWGHSRSRSTQAGVPVYMCTSTHDVCDCTAAPMSLLVAHMATPVLPYSLCDAKGHPAAAAAAAKVPSLLALHLLWAKKLLHSYSSLITELAGHGLLMLLHQVLACGHSLVPGGANTPTCA